MPLKPDAQAKLEYFLKRGTWASGHDDDRDHWYDFVDRYEKDHGHTIDEPWLREIMARIAGVTLTGDHYDQLGYSTVDKTIDDLISDAYKILDFLKRTGR